MYDMSNTSVLLLLINIATSFYSMGTIWLTQVDWLLWKHVGRESFSKYHLAWWHSVWWSIFPIAGLSFSGIILQLIWQPPVSVWILWLALGIQIIAAAGTATWWGQKQAKLKQVVLPDGRLDKGYSFLVHTNWIRVGLYTLAAIVELWIGILCFTGR
jgi:hypothetical protein